MKLRLSRLSGRWISDIEQSSNSKKKNDNFHYVRLWLASQLVIRQSIELLSLSVYTTSTENKHEVLNKILTNVYLKDSLERQHRLGTMLDTQTQFDNTRQNTLEHKA